MSTNKELQRIKAALGERPKGPGRRIAPEVRSLIARYARRRLAAGTSRVAIAAELGVGDGTVARVLQTAAEVELVPVRLTSEGLSSATVRGPGGLTIEGLDIEGLAALIRALS